MPAVQESTNRVLPCGLADRWE